jgi:peptidoglycan/xylan/chitin deacetylase (PgdA/CDA1 family)
VTRRAALLAGFAVLAMLLSGQVIAGWYDRPTALAAALRNIDRRPAPTPPTPPGAAPTARPQPPPPPGGRPPRKRDSRAAYLTALGVKRTTTGGGVALTFDDGPHPTWTPKILALLRTHRLKAMFCLVGTEVQRYPGLVAQMVREGHAVCNHSWRHEFDLGKRPAAEIRANLQRTNAAIQRAAPGSRIAYYRQPGGLWTRAVVQVSRALGMVPLDWTVDPTDWADVTAAQIKARVLRQARKGSVILLHDGGGDRAATTAACRKMLPDLKRRFRIAPVR